MKQKEKLIIDVMEVSCGTLSTLTGLNKYTELDLIRRDWIQFIDINPYKYSFSGWNWIQSWRAFSLHTKRQCAVRRTIKGN